MDDNRFLKAAVGFIAFAVAGVVLKVAKPVLFPFFLAIFISYIVNPALEVLTRLKVPRALAVLILILVTFSLLYGLGAVFYTGGKAFAAEIPAYTRQFESLLARLDSARFLGAHWSVSTLLEAVNPEKLAAFAYSALGPFLSFLSTLFLVLVFLVFILSGRGKLAVKVERAFSPAQARRIAGILENIDGQIERYLAIKTVFCVINGLTVGVVLALFGVKFAVVFGFLAFLLNYIPNIGSTVATLIPVIVAFLQYGSVWRSLTILAIVVALDNVMGNIFEPKFMGKGLGLSPLFVIFSLIFWGWLWGIPGMVLSVPITAVIRIVCANVPSLRPLAELMGK